jgi:hypothetical protein
MAGIKVTDLPSLTTAESNDILYIVDTSTNTSKKIEVGDIITAPTLESVLITGNDTNGNDINIGDDAIVNSQNSKLKKGSVDNGSGGGISLICTLEKELQFENGVRYMRPLGGNAVYAESLDNINPDEFYDNTRFFQIGSRFKNLVTGIEFICINANTNNAEWIPSSGRWFPTESGSSSGSIDNISFVRAYYSVVGNIVNCSVFGNADFNFVTLLNGFVNFSNVPIQTNTFYPIGYGTMAENVNIICTGETKFRFFDNGSLLNANANFVIHFTYEIN